MIFTKSPKEKEGKKQRLAASSGKAINKYFVCFPSFLLMVVFKSFSKLIFISQTTFFNNLTQNLRFII